MSAFTDLHTFLPEQKASYRAGQDAKAAEIVAFIDERLAAMMSRPKMYAPLDAIELQVLALLGVRDAALGRPQRALDEFRVFIAKRVRAGNTSLHARLRQQYDDDAEARGIRRDALDDEFAKEFIGILGGFVLSYRSPSDAR